MPTRGSFVSLMNPGPRTDIARLPGEALACYQSGRLAEAQRLSLQVLSIDVRNASCLHLLGLIESRSGNLESAVKMMRRAIGSDNRKVHFHIDLVNILNSLGKFDEAIQEYEQALSLDPDRADAHYNLGHAYHVQGQLDKAIASYERAVRLRPKYAEAYNNLGVALHVQGRLQEAVVCFEQALTLKPDYAEAHNNLGGILKDLGKLDQAAASYQRALRIQSDYAGAYSNLGAVLQLQGRLPEAVACLQKALLLQPDSAEAHYRLGSALHAQGKLEDAAALYAQALALAPDHVGAQFDRSMLQLLQSDYAIGWRNCESRFRVKKIAPRSFPQPLWHGEPLNGARILLHDEQGLGDSLQFLRYLPGVHAAGGSVILAVQKKLRRIATQLPGVACLVHAGDPLPPFDWHCPLMSLPAACGTTLKTIPAQVPYLSAPRDAIEAAAALYWPKTGGRVGLAWAGRPDNQTDETRSMPLTLLNPLFGIENVHFFSLQMGSAAEQSADVNADITDLASVTTDFADTAAHMAHMDLVITVDTSVAHMAGALARPTWVLLSNAADWRWLLNREDSPWYPTVRLFRQPKLGDWTSVIEAVRIALLERSQAFSGVSTRVETPDDPPQQPTMISEEMRCLRCASL